jgi:hypothetical protein
MSTYSNNEEWNEQKIGKLGGMQLHKKRAMWADHVKLLCCLGIPMTRLEWNACKGISDSCRGYSLLLDLLHVKDKGRQYVQLHHVTMCVNWAEVPAVGHAIIQLAEISSSCNSIRHSHLKVCNVCMEMIMKITVFGNVAPCTFTEDIS